MVVIRWILRKSQRQESGERTSRGEETRVVYVRLFTAIYVHKAASRASVRRTRHGIGGFYGSGCPELCFECLLDRVHRLSSKRGIQTHAVNPR